MLQKIFIASDHAGFALKESLKKQFPHFSWEDLGPESEDRVDYPDFAHSLCEKVIASDYKTLGVLICGSGQGMVISANKHKGIRAALCWTPEIAALSKEHNDANVLCLSSRCVSEQTNFEIFNSFITTEFAGGRHLDRVNKIENTKE